jgi:hypothetical protein
MRRVRIVIVPWSNTGPWALSVWHNDLYQRYITLDELPPEMRPLVAESSVDDAWFDSLENAERVARYVAILENA